MAGFKEYVHITALAGGLSLATFAVGVSVENEIREDRIECMKSFKGNEEELCLEMVNQDNDKIGTLMGILALATGGVTVAAGCAAYERRPR